MGDELARLIKENEELRKLNTTASLEFIQRQYAFWNANIQIGAALAEKKDWLPNYDKGGLWAAFAMHALSGGQKSFDAKIAADVLIKAFENRYGRLGTVPPAD
jgi:hypothetical protein